MVSSRLKPEERVNVAVGLVDVVTQVSAEYEKKRNPTITEDRLIFLLRKRFQLGRSNRR